MAKINGNGFHNNIDNVVGNDSISPENANNSQKVSLDQSNLQAKYMPNLNDQQDPLLKHSSNNIEPARTPVAQSPAKTSPKNSSLTRRYITLACICLVNLLNYMDRFTIPGKLQIVFENRFIFN